MATSEYDKSEKLLHVSLFVDYFVSCRFFPKAVKVTLSFMCCFDSILAFLSEYLKRDDQILPLRLQQEERRTRMTTNAKDRDRALANFKSNDIPSGDIDLDLDDEAGLDEASGLGGQDALGSKIIVVHPGSQNLRIGLASDALPKTVPMVIARRSTANEAEELDGEMEPKPKRLKLDNGAPLEPEKMFGDDVKLSFAKDNHRRLLTSE